MPGIRTGPPRCTPKVCREYGLLLRRRSGLQLIRRAVERRSAERVVRLRRCRRSGRGRVRRARSRRVRRPRPPGPPRPPPRSAGSAASARAAEPPGRRTPVRPGPKPCAELAGRRIEFAAADRVEAIVHHPAIEARHVAVDGDAPRSGLRSENPGGSSRRAAASPVSVDSTPAAAAACVCTVKVSKRCAAGAVAAGVPAAPDCGWRAAAGLAHGVQAAPPRRGAVAVEAHAARARAENRSSDRTGAAPTVIDARAA